MENNYNPIAAQILKLETGKRSKLFQNEIALERQIFEDEIFLKAINNLKNKFQVVAKLLGDENFNSVVLRFIATNPLQSSNPNKYGHNFAEFLISLDELSRFDFLYFLAQLDWYWFTENEAGPNIVFPKGTLKSWASLISEGAEINIDIDITKRETLKILKQNNEYQIVEV
jgi:hypothetical protein